MSVEEIEVVGLFAWEMGFMYFQIEEEFYLLKIPPRDKLDNLLQVHNSQSVQQHPSRSLE